MATNATVEQALAMETTLQEKVNRIISEGRPKAREVLGFIEDQGQHLADYVWPLGPDGLGFDIRDDTIVLQPPAVHGPDMTFGDMIAARNSGAFVIHQHGVEQAAERLKLPVPYLRDLSLGEDWQRRLAAENLDQTSRHRPAADRALVRVVGTKALAFLSDQYRRLDSMPIVEGFTQSLNEEGAQPFEAFWEDTRFSIGALLPQVFPVPIGEHGIEFLSFGVRLRSSDFGDGALHLAAFSMRVQCINLHVGQSAMRQVHFGKRLPSAMAFSQRTYRLDTEATASAVRDTTRLLISGDRLRQEVDELRQAANAPVDAEARLTTLVRGGQLTGAERDLMMRVLAQGDESQVPAGPATRYKLANAISWAGTVSENPRRRADLQELAGEFMAAK